MLRIVGFVVAALWGCGPLAVQAASAATQTSYFDLNLKQNRYLGEAQNSAQQSNYTFISGDNA